MSILGSMVKQTSKWLGAVAASGALLFAAFHLLFVRDASDLKSITTTVASIAATLLGFVLTALTILAALANRRMMANMKKTGHNNVLVEELFGCAVLFLVTTATALMSLLAAQEFRCQLSTAAVTFFALGVLTLVSCGSKFFNVMTTVGGTSGEAPRPGPAIT